MTDVPTIISTDAVQGAAYYELTREHVTPTGHVIRIHLTRPHDTDRLRARAWVKVFDPAELAWKTLCEWESDAWVRQTPAALAPGAEPGDTLGGIADELHRRACVYLTSGLLHPEEVLNTDVDADGHGYGLTRIHTTPTGHVVRVRVWAPFESQRHTRQPIADAHVFDVDDLVWEPLVSLGQMDWYWPSTGLPEESIPGRLKEPADGLYGLARAVLAHASGVILPHEADAESDEDADDVGDVGDVVHLLVRIGGYAAVHTLGTRSVDIYDDASAWDYNNDSLANFDLPAAGELSLGMLADALDELLRAWFSRHPDREAAINAPTTTTSHLVVRHSDFAAVGQIGHGVIEIYPDVTVWNDGGTAQHTEEVPAGQVLTPDVVAAAANKWWSDTAVN